MNDKQNAKPDGFTQMARGQHPVAYLNSGPHYCKEQLTPVLSVMYMYSTCPCRYLQEVIEQSPSNTTKSACWSSANMQPHTCTACIRPACSDAIQTHAAQQAPLGARNQDISHLLLWHIVRQSAHILTLPACLSDTACHRAVFWCRLVAISVQPIHHAHGHHKGS
jgi:hypothetical protein